MEYWQKNAWELALAGGPFMLPIILCSLCSWAIIIEKFLYLGSLKTHPKEFLEKVLILVKDNKITDAISFCEEHGSPTAEILKSGLLKFGSPQEDIRDALERASRYEIPLMEKRLAALLTIANITPLIGFLGTATGLAVGFHTIQIRAVSLHPVLPGDLAAGIWQALIATIASLAVAIPAYIFYNYFVHRIRVFTRDIEQSANDLADYLSQM